MSGINEVNDTHISLAHMFPVQAARILLESALPGNRHGQYQSIQCRVVETLPNQFPGCQDHPWGIGWQCFQSAD
ncbi:hypothetical protein D9M68_801070 [compost metagenome]